MGKRKGKKENNTENNPGNVLPAVAVKGAAKDKQQATRRVRKHAPSTDSKSAPTLTDVLAGQGMEKADVAGMNHLVLPRTVHVEGNVNVSKFAI
jgi:hypothetical protein